MTASFLPAPSAGRKIYQVQELTALLRAEVERRFSDVWVEGEVANLKIPSSGHFYFTLKDGAAQIRAIIFRSHGRFLKFIPKEGRSVLIRGHLTVYDAKGEYQLIVDYVEPKGAGALQAAFEALKEKLRLEGLFSPDRKKAIPRLPRRIGLITSPTGAALRDILKIFSARELPSRILIHPAAVQGEGAADEIARAVDEMNRIGAEAPEENKIDLLILARGGGSIEDLWAFNEEIVARAIARSKIPIVSAVGHETDTTIADFVADLRAPTPSAAAEGVVRGARETLDRFGALAKRLEERTREGIEGARDHLFYEMRLLAAPGRRIDHLADRVAHLTIRLRHAFGRGAEERRMRLLRRREGLRRLSPIERLSQFRRRRSEWSDRLFRSGVDLIARARHRLESRIAQLDLLSPLNILGRGYSVTRTLPSRTILRDAAEVSPGERVEILLERGKVIASVEERIDPESA